MNRNIEFKWQPKEQSGFLSGYSTPDHIHIINQVAKKYAEYTDPL